MIRSFANRETELVYNGICPPGLPNTILKVARRKLRMIDAAKDVRDLRSPPGNKLHKLHKDRKGQMAIWINAQYRICFRWRAGHAYDVEIDDYHK
jgi:proteic killer suppression protein